VNKQFAIRLASELKSAGFSVWMDQFDIPTGARWDDEIEKALRECQIFLFIITPASIASDNAKDEMGYAIDHDKYILPVLLEECEVPLRLRRMQYVDFTQMSFDEGIDRAKQLLSKLVREIEESGAEVSKPGSEKSAQNEPVSTPTGRGTIFYPPQAKIIKARNRTGKPIIAGIGVLVVGTLVIAAFLFRPLLFPSAPSPRPTLTRTPGKDSIPTDTSSPTSIIATPVPEVSSSFTADFNSDVQWNKDWTLQYRNGNPRKKESFFHKVAEGQMVFDLAYKYIWAYFVYNAYTNFKNVELEVVANDLQSIDTIGLVCQYGDKGWYEIDINGGGKYFLRYVDGMNSDQDEARYLIRERAIPHFKFSTDQARDNTIKVKCNGNHLSLSVNDIELITDYPVSTPILEQGQIGIAIRSYQNYPVHIVVKSLKVSGQ
jgi:hypothetical protein